LRVFVIVLDGVGMGALPDADRYGDAGANTLLHVAEHAGTLSLPMLETFGLGNLLAMPGVRPTLAPRGARARLTEKSAGKDSTTGHWEMMGIRSSTLSRPIPTASRPRCSTAGASGCSAVG